MHYANLKTEDVPHTYLDECMKTYNDLYAKIPETLPFQIFG